MGFSIDTQKKYGTMEEVNILKYLQYAWLLPTKYHIAIVSTVSLCPTSIIRVKNGNTQQANFFPA